MTFRCSSTWRQGTTSESRGGRDGSTTSYVRSAWRSNGREARRAQRLRPLRDTPAGISRDPLAWQQAKRRGAEPRSTSLSRSRSRSAESTRGLACEVDGVVLFGSYLSGTRLAALKQEQGG